MLKYSSNFTVTIQKYSLCDENRENFIFICILYMFYNELTEIIFIIIKGLNECVYKKKKRKKSVIAVPTTYLGMFNHTM